MKAGDRDTHNPGDTWPPLCILLLKNAFPE